MMKFVILFAALAGVAWSVTCGDGSYCPDGTTCCKLKAAGYGCCPFPEATCCSDGEHCCPDGYTCDLAAGSCNKKGFLSVVMEGKVPAVKLETAEMPTAWVTCTACTYVVNKAKSYVVNNETIAHFVTMMEEMCLMVPVAYKAECEGAFESYGPTIVNLIDSELSSLAICRLMRLCGFTAPYSANQCESCIAMTDSLGGPTEALLLTANTICANLNIASPTCTSFVQQYSQYVAMIAPVESRVLCNDVC